VLDFLNVRYFVGPPGQPPPGNRWKPAYSGPDATVFENTSVLPRVFAPDAVRLVGPPPSSGILPPADALIAFAGVLPEMAALRDWRSVAFVAGDSRVAAWRSGAQPAGGSIRDYREETNRASFVVANPSQKEITIVASLVQDGGWTASAKDGAPLPIAYANGPFLAILAPPGTHEVRLRYASPGIDAGSAGTGATAALLAVVLWRSRRSGRRGPAGPAPPISSRV
jgi:hypothetical protein